MQLAEQKADQEVLPEVIGPVSTSVWVRITPCPCPGMTFFVQMVFVPELVHSQYRTKHQVLAHLFGNGT